MEGRRKGRNLTQNKDTFCFRSTISSSPTSFSWGRVTMPLFNWSNSSFKQRISFWYFLMSDFSSIICEFMLSVTRSFNKDNFNNEDNSQAYTLFCDAWISICFARWTNFKVLCVSSALLDDGVTVHMSCKKDDWI